MLYYTNKVQGSILETKKGAAQIRRSCRYHNELGQSQYMTYPRRFGPTDYLNALANVGPK